MIEMFENGHDKPANLYCSLHCRALLTGTQGQRIPQTSTSGDITRNLSDSRYFKRPSIS